MSPSNNAIEILAPLAVAVAATGSTILIHAVGITTIIHFGQARAAAGTRGCAFVAGVLVVAASASVALAAHLLEIAVWAEVFE